MTEAEVVLWNHLRKRQIKSIQFLRQKPIGHYIVDFYAPEIRLVIEVDGGQHFGDEAEVYDQKRDAFLASQKLKVIRFSNLDVLQNIQGVIERIAEAVQ
jgi:very-short-patch-repair endonuclease